MGCKGNSKERIVTLALFHRLHVILQLQATCGARLSEGNRKLLSRAVYATYTDLSDLGHKKAAFWYMNRRPVKTIFIRGRREKALLHKIESTARAYRNARSAGRMYGLQNEAEVQSLYAALEDYVKKAVRIGLQKQVEQIVRDLGLI